MPNDREHLYFLCGKSVKIDYDGQSMVFPDAPILVEGERGFLCLGFSHKEDIERYIDFRDSRDGTFIVSEREFKSRFSSYASNPFIWIRNKYDTDLLMQSDVAFPYEEYAMHFEDLDRVC